MSPQVLRWHLRFEVGSAVARCDACDRAPIIASVARSAPKDSCIEALKNGIREHFETVHPGAIYREERAFHQ